MKFLIVFGLLIAANSISADWEAYRNAILRFERTGIHYDSEWAKYRSADTRALPFTCKPIAPSSSVPTSVNRLRPGDIRVVGAIGDSLTAANGAKASTLLGLLTEYRGLSWSMGGDNSATTLPNMIRVYNPQVKGFSLGSGSYTSSGAAFNVARPGHTSNEMLEQAQELVKRIKNSGNVNFDEDWKLITFFIGGNDLCKFCKDPNKYKPEVFYKNLRETLDYFQNNLPRTLVNMVLTLDVSGIEVLNSGFVCQTMHTTLCECGITEANAEVLNYLVSNFQRLTKELIESGRYDTHDDFTVVLQPFMEQMKPPMLSNGKPDYSFFAPDCFHFSVKGHETAALELWNNMFEPVGQKVTEWTAYVGELMCPTEDKPYIYTNKNSK